MNKDKQIEETWKIAKNILEESLTGKPYQKYLKPQPLENNSINCIMCKMLSHATNTPKKENAIKFNENKEDYASILKQFNPVEILKMSDETIENMLKTKIASYQKGAWGKQYVKVIKDIATFLEHFKDANDFIKFCQLINEKVDKKYLPKMLQDIFWYGPAISRDFLKELGFDCYAKPDVHVKDFISQIFNCENNEQEVLEVINKIAEISKETIYSIDKIIYLSCTHDFYLNGDNEHRDNKNKSNNNQRKLDLIEKIKKEIEN